MMPRGLSVAALPIAFNMKVGATAATATAFAQEIPAKVPSASGRGAAPTTAILSEDMDNAHICQQIIQLRNAPRADSCYALQQQLAQFGDVGLWQKYRSVLAEIIQVMLRTAEHELVVLHIYHLGPNSVNHNLRIAAGYPGSVFVHGAVELFGIEVSHGSGGVYTSSPKQDPCHIYWHSEPLGLTTCKSNDVAQFIQTFNEQGAAYSAITKNCLDFSNEISISLGTGPINPKWNKSAQAARYFAPRLAQGIMELCNGRSSGSSDNDPMECDQDTSAVDDFILPTLPAPFNDRVFQDNLSARIGDSQGTVCPCLVREGSGVVEATMEVHIIKMRHGGGRNTFTVTTQGGLWVPVDKIIESGVGTKRTTTGNRYTVKRCLAPAAGAPDAKKQKC